MTRIRVRRIPPRARGLMSSYAAQLQIPVAGYGVGADGDAVITVGAVGWSFGSALRKATSIAKHITDDPIVKAMMPPQAKAAIATARKLSKAARRGKSALKKAWGSLPPGLRKQTKGLANKLLRKSKASRSRPQPEAYEDGASTDHDLPGDEMLPDGLPEVSPEDVDAYLDEQADDEEGGEQ